MVPAPRITVSAYTTLYTTDETTEILAPDGAHAYRDGPEARYALGDGTYLITSAVGNGNAHGINSRYVTSNLQLPMGPAGDPTGRRTDVTVSGVPAGYHYCAPCGLVRNPLDNSILATTHIEKPPDGQSWVYGSIGLARSSDLGQTWTHLGEILLPGAIYMDTYEANFEEIGGAPIACVGPWLYVWFKESGGLGDEGASVARTDAAAAYAAAASGGVTTWQKWDGSGWSVPALSGKGAYLWGPTIPGGQAAWDSQYFYPNFFDVTYHRQTGLFLAANYGKRSYLIWSRDGIRWSRDRITLTEDAPLAVVYGQLWPLAYAGPRSGSGDVLLTYVYITTDAVGNWLREIRQRAITIHDGPGRAPGASWRGGKTSTGLR